MELGNSICRLLDKENISGEKKHKFETSSKGLLFNLILEDKGKYSYLFDSIEIKNPGNDATLDLPELERRGNLLCEKLTYLSEDLTLIEIDASQGMALIRSKISKEDSKKQEIEYFEVNFSVDRNILVKRYDYNKQTKLKSKQNFNLTTDITKKFINHLIETVA